MWYSASTIYTKLCIEDQITLFRAHNDNITILYSAYDISHIEAEMKNIKFNYRPKLIQDLCIGDQRALVSFHPDNIKLISNPCLGVQIDTVYYDGDLIEYIENPSDKVQIYAVKQNPSSLRKIKNPCLEAQLVAINSNPITIQYIENPCEEAQIAAVTQAPFTIFFIKNSTEKVQILSVTKDPCAVGLIQNPCKKIIDDYLNKINDNVPADFNCPICLDNNTAKTVIKLDCNHHFHSECMSRWYIKNKSCPLCRQIIK